MGVTAFPGNLVVFGAAPSLDYNGSDATPSFGKSGFALLDPRSYFTYENGAAVTNTYFGWSGNGLAPVIDQVPTVVSSNSIAQTQAVTAGTAITLTTSNTNNGTVTTITAPETGTSVSVVAIDGVMAGVTYGSDAQANIWSPATAISRCITITTTGNDLGGYWTIAGRDIYGIKVTETISASSSAATYTSQKAYKYIQAITPTTTGTFASTSVIVGVADKFGLPIYASNGAYCQIYYNNALVVSSTNVTAGATATATSTTGDVRGTFTSSAASNGTIRLVVLQAPNVASLSGTFGSASTVQGQGIVGVAQYSSV